MKEFQMYRKILVVCPCCGQFHRLSELNIKSAKPVKTWLDDYKKRERFLDKQIENFESSEGDVRKTKVKKGRSAAQRAYLRVIDPKLKKYARNPHDLKTIYDPIDYVVFKGMNDEKKIEDVLFLAKSARNPELNKIRAQVKKAIKQKSYQWKVARISDTGRVSYE